MPELGDDQRSHRGSTVGAELVQAHNPLSGQQRYLMPAMPIESSEVLIVDDSPTDAELTMHALRHDGVAPAVTWRTNGEEVVQHLSTSDYPRWMAT